MKILHYSLGFPPYRTGGLTKYCMDLMLAQKELGHDVSLIWPGQFQIILKEPKLKQKKKCFGIDNYEIINPLPVSLDEGILNIKAYTKEIEKNIFINFLKELNPDVIHIHSLMGLHKELVLSAKELEIHTVFTTHDYFGLCPKVNMFCQGHVCENSIDCFSCAKCNQSALSLKKIYVMQSSLYRKMKDTRLVKMLRKRHRDEFFDYSTKNNMLIEDKIKNVQAVDYQMLRLYYISILQNIEMIHFNSSVSEKIYNQYFTPKNSMVLNITHKNIKDNKKIKNYNHNKIRFTYLAYAKPFKGYLLLKKALDRLCNDGVYDFELNVFGITDKTSTYIKTHRQYNYDDLEEILDKTDLVVTPSICYETFGFTVLEALSYGVPVIVSDNVGSKDIVSSGGIVVKADCVESLYQALKSITMEKLKELNKKIVEEVNIVEYKEFVNLNFSLYKERVKV